MLRRSLSAARFSAANSHELIGVLDIGASKVSCFIADMVPGALDGQDAEIIGVGIHANESMGESGLVELSSDESVRTAMQKAIKMAGQQPASWHVAVSGRHIACRRLAVDLKLDGHSVLEEDLAECYRMGAEHAASHSMTPLHIWPSTFSIDGLDHIRDPRGMVGNDLAVYLVGLSASNTAIANITNCLDRCQVTPASFIAAPYAASLAVLQEEEKNLGVLCLDMGANLTGFTIYRQGNLIFAGVVPLGSNHITRDIAQIFNLGPEQAERAKTVFGTGFCAPGDDQRFIDFIDEDSGKAVSVAALAEVIGPRLEEILELVKTAIEESGLESAILRRVVLTGGGSQLQGVCELVETLHDVKVRIGRPLNIIGAPEATSGSAFAVCAGMIRHLAQEREAKSYGIPHFRTLGQKDPEAPAGYYDTSPLGRVTGWLQAHF